MQVANYILLEDEPFELKADQVKRVRKFELPNNFVKGTLLAKPILTYKVLPLSTSVKYIIALNDLQGDENIPSSKVVESRTLDQKVYRSLHEAVDGNKFIPGESLENLIDFRVVLGSAMFSDVVLWFRVEI
ncbi:hypothetical protein IQ265_04740 [Nodosilinea sp. LEGE 06152]|uniref:hypothetical protein n=1 Tax=Nodosilinea sp. LEGE 06152 TaxID=2777966 RepID=UPI001882777D|nr:hypothetical protein [Nodosilinea sp. LEGE 06152]MBE9156142.1 hypothetical protein [Nodosilinea sp. LEGE 06152]